MTNDQQTFKRGATAAAIGLGVQILLSLVVLIGAIAVNSPGVTAAVWHFFAGIPIWIILLMVYNQHRQERVEALETEQLAQADAEAGAIFDEHAEELQLSRRRLDRLYKWGLGGISLLVAVYLMVVGVAMLVVIYGKLDDGTLAENILHSRFLASSTAGGILAVASLALALVMFLIARYVAGMTKIKQWQLLRGGASFLMGNAVIVVLVAVAAGWFYFFFEDESRTILFQYLALAVPAILALIGVEIALTFLLSAYRPRRPGEIPRPAFDSRLLGFLTSPESLGRIVAETINYQFGFEISRSWFYQLLAKAVTPLVIFGVVALLALSCIVAVQPHQEAIITKFGAKQGKIGPGLHFKLPWPLASAERYSVERVHQISVGSIKEPPKAGVPILWTTQHAVGMEKPLITAASTSSIETDDENGEDENGENTNVQGMSLIAAEVIVQFRVKDIEKFVERAPNPEQLEEAARQRDEFAQRNPPGRKEGEKIIDPCPLLTAIAERCVAEYFANQDIDALLGEGRQEAGAALMKKMRATVDDPAIDLGIEIVQVGLTQVHPPQNDGGEGGDEGAEPVPEKFHESIAALQEKESEIQLARQEEAKILSTTAGSIKKADELFAAIEYLNQLRTGNAPDAEIVDADIVDAERTIEDLLTTKAGGTASQVINDAWAYRWSKAIAARGEAERFRAELLSFEVAPEYYRQRAYLNVMAEHLPHTRRFLYPRSMGNLPNVIEVDLKSDADTLPGIIGED